METDNGENTYVIGDFKTSPIHKSTRQKINRDTIGLKKAE